MTERRWLDQVLGRQVFELPCTVRIENTREFLHTEVDLVDFEVAPGDEVRVIDAPTAVDDGEKLECERRATVTRGGPLDALWARAAAIAEFPELYDLSFTTRRQL